MISTSTQVTRKEYEQFVEIATEANRILTLSCSGDVVMTDLDEKVRA
jgi:hypothetical protein